jgi:hypothetical protein
MVHILLESRIMVEGFGDLGAQSADVGRWNVSASGDL